MLKQISIKVGLLLLMLVVLNGIYNLFFFEKDMAKVSNEILQARTTQTETDVYYFGESSNFNTQEDDSIKSSISEISSYFYPHLRFTSINRPAAHAGIFKYWLREIHPQNGRPKAVIITMNLRSFNAAWIRSKLEMQLQESLVFTYPFPNLFNRFLLSLQPIDNKTEQQREKLMKKDWRSQVLKFPFKFKHRTTDDWNFTMSNGGHLKPDGTYDTEKCVLACHYIKAYALNLDDKNPRIKDFDEIARYCEQNKIKLYYNLLAENVEYADSLVGKELVYLMKENRDFLMKRYNSENCTVVDNLELVPGLEFTDQTWTTEHYGYRGRMAIARNLANHLKKHFEKEYNKAY